MATIFADEIKIKEYLLLADEVLQMAKALHKEACELDPLRFSEWLNKEGRFKIGPSTVEISGKVWDRGHHVDNEYDCFPTWWLYDDGWRDSIIRHRARITKEEEDRQEKIRKEREREHAHYLKLKKKYGEE